MSAPLSGRFSTLALYFYAFLAVLDGFNAARATTGWGQALFLLWAVQWLVWALEAQTKRALKSRSHR